MPDLIADALDPVGERLEDWLDLRPVDPLYRAHYADGSTLDVRADVDAMAAEVERVCGARRGGRLPPVRRRTSPRCTGWRCAASSTATSTRRSACSARTWPGWSRCGGFRRLSTEVEQLPEGPPDAAGLLLPGDVRRAVAVPRAGHLRGDRVHGLGGRRVLPGRRDARGAAGAGRGGGEARGAVPVRHRGDPGGGHRRPGPGGGAPPTASGSPADVVVLNPDLPIAYRQLLPAAAAPRRLGRLRYSPSCVVLLAGSTAAYPGAAHHNIHFGRAWRRTFAELIRDEQLMSDPSVLVTNPSRSDPSLAPPGRHTYYVLVPTPNLDRRHRLGQHRPALPRRAGGHPGGPRLPGLRRRHRGGAAGHAGRLGGVRAWPRARRSRPRTPSGRPGRSGRGRWPRAENVVFTGSGTQPGVGVPMVLISGRLAAERITGRDRQYRSRAWR